LPEGRSLTIIADGIVDSLSVLVDTQFFIVVHGYPYRTGEHGFLTLIVELGHVWVFDGFGGAKPFVRIEDQAFSDEVQAFARLPRQSVLVISPQNVFKVAGLGFDRSQHALGIIGVHRQNILLGGRSSHFDGPL
jgi:hypothetical protein